MNQAIGPPYPKPAATIMLLRDDTDGIRILILRKAPGKHFAGGALVFPGGKVAASDEKFTGDVGEKRNIYSSLKIAAIREMYEECGIALVRELGSNSLLDNNTITTYQRAHDNIALLDLAAVVPLGLATDFLVRFAHWITPPSRPKRYDTHFFIAGAPPGQTKPTVDGYEIVEAQWYKPENLLNQVLAGSVRLVLPTLMNIMKLSEIKSVKQAIQMAQSGDIVPVTPVRKQTQNGECLIIPEEAGYGMTEIPLRFLRSS